MGKAMSKNSQYQLPDVNLHYCINFKYNTTYVTQYFVVCANTQIDSGSNS